MSIQGTHKSFSIPELFNVICTRRLSGMLVIATRDQDRTFHFVNGEVVYAMATEPGHLLGDLIAREFGIDPAAIDECSRANRGTLLGEGLVRSGLLTRESLNSVLEREVRLLLRDVLHWKEWAFHFERIATPQTQTKLSLSTQLMIFDMTRELDEWESIDEILPDLEQVPLRSGGSMHLKVEWGPELPPLGEVLAEIDGTRTLRIILLESAYPCRPYATALAHLIQAGIVQLVDRDPADVTPSAQKYALAAVYPKLAERLLGAWRRDDTDSNATLQGLAQCDPVIVARVLQVAHHQRRATEGPFSLGSLVGSIGAQPLKSLLHADTLRSLFLNPGSGELNRLWEEAYLAGIACRMIAERTRFPEPDLAQCAALLQDIGRMVLIGEHGVAYDETCALERIHSDYLLRLEQARFGIDHCSAGHQLATDWGFPERIAHVIRHHHSVAEGVEEDPLLPMVRFANFLVHATHATVNLTIGKKLMRQLRFPNDEYDELRDQLTDWQNRPALTR